MFIELKFKSPEDVKNVNKVASEQEFDMFVSDENGTTQVNAKSILALFTLIGKHVRLVAPDHIEPDKFIEAVRSLG